MKFKFIDRLVPGTDGCFFLCPIQKKEHGKSHELCCDAGRVCCFTCLEECNIKKKYKGIIQTTNDRLGE